MKQEIADRFSLNLSRVRNLSTIYQQQLSGSGQGRRGHSKTDVLRAAIVLLHATIEDLLRSLASWKLPSSDADVLCKIPLIDQRAEKFTLGELSAHRNKSVEDVISDSVNGYLQRSNYNNTDDISALLISIGVQLSNVNARFPQITKLMERRHQIVHRADRDDTGGRGHHVVHSISHSVVRGWIDDVEVFGNAVLNELPE